MVETASQSDLDPRQHLFGFDIVRFAAALCVFFFHTCYGDQHSNSIASQILAGRAFFSVIEGAAWPGWIGVQVFFVISGAVIGFSAQGASAARFAQSRLLRLYPTAWICSALTAITVVAFGVLSWRTTLSHLLKQMTLLASDGWLDRSYWTLPVEITFYALVTLLLASGLRRRLPNLAYALIALSAVVSALNDKWYLKLVHALHFKFLMYMPEYGVYFGLGILIQQSATQKTLPLTSIIFTTLALIVMPLQVMRYIRIDFPAPPVGWSLAPLAILTLALAVLYVSVRKAALISRTVRGWAPFIRTIGLMTYPLYLVHQVCGAAVLRLAIGIGLPPAAALLADLALCLIWAWAMVQVDKALRPQLTRWLDHARRSIRASRGVSPTAGPFSP